MTPPAEQTTEELAQNVTELDQIDVLTQQQQALYNALMDEIDSR